MQTLFSSPLIPITAGFIFLLIAGYFEFKTYRVPNRLVVGSLLLAIVFAIVAQVVVPDRTGGIGSSLFGMILGGAMLIPIYIKGGLGAGCVKAQAAFGAWAGAGLGFSQCLNVMFIATIVAVIFAAAAWFFAYQQRKRQQISDEDKTQILLHGQLPLSLGTMLGVVVATMF